MPLSAYQFNFFLIAYAYFPVIIGCFSIHYLIIRKLNLNTLMHVGQSEWKSLSKVSWNNGTKHYVIRYVANQLCDKEKKIEDVYCIFAFFGIISQPYLHHSDALYV